MDGGQVSGIRARAADGVRFEQPAEGVARIVLATDGDVREFVQDHFAQQFGRDLGECDVQANDTLGRHGIPSPAP